MMKQILLLLLFFFSFSEAFRGHQVLRVVPKNDEQITFLRHHARGLDFWTEPVKNRPADVQVPPELLGAFTSALKSSSMEYSVFIKDLQTLIDQQHAPPTETNFYAQYHSLEDIQTWMAGLASQHPDIVNIINIGTSFEGRKLSVLRLTQQNDTRPKVGIWLDGCIHAREWITTATLLYATSQFIDGFNANNNTFVTLLQMMEIYIMPVFNVDGYAYTWTTNRMWRKTRSTNSGSRCVGTDPNRNWDWQWGGAGADGNPCSESYYGASPFSEIEVKSVADFIWTHSSTLRGYINFHSYSQLWMSPWGYTTDFPKDYVAQNNLSGWCTQAITAVFGTQYQYGPIATTIYPASGNSADWTYGNSSIVYSYGVELRDQGQYGFVLPAREIIPSGQETLPAIVLFAQTVLKEQTKKVSGGKIYMN